MNRLPMLTIVIISWSLVSATSMAKPKPKGFWCAKWTRASTKSEGSACGREKVACDRAADAFARLRVSTGPCVWQAQVWGSRIEQENTPPEWLFMTQEHCEKARQDLAGSECRVVR